jgi:hypothetical protein
VRQPKRQRIQPLSKGLHFDDGNLWWARVVCLYVSATHANSHAVSRGFQDERGILRNALVGVNYQYFMPFWGRL